MSTRASRDPQYQKPLTRLIDRAAGPLDRAGYEAEGGYAAFKKMARELTPQATQTVVKDSNLRGRGGAGFPTGVKWGLIPLGPDAGTKYFVRHSGQRTANCVFSPDAEALTR